MRRSANVAAAVLAACLGSAGCGPSKSPQPYISNPPQPGTQEPFLVVLSNMTQWELDFGLATSLSTGQTGHLIVPAGGHADVLLNVLPYSVTAQAVTTSVPQYAYPPKTVTFGQDFGPYSTSVGISFP